MRRARPAATPLTCWAFRRGTNGGPQALVQTEWVLMPAAKLEAHSVWKGANFKNNYLKQNRITRLLAFVCRERQLALHLVIQSRQSATTRSIV